MRAPVRAAVAFKPITLAPTPSSCATKGSKGRIGLKPRRSSKTTGKRMISRRRGLLWPSEGPLTGRRRRLPAPFVGHLRGLTEPR